MAKDLNKVMLTGRLGADPEMRFTPQGSAVTNFRVASNRSWKTPDGDQRDETEWFSIVAWNKLAEICNQYLTKGSRVYIEGRAQTRSWEDEATGQTRYKTEVVATDMIILDSRNGQADDHDTGEDFEGMPSAGANRRQAAPAVANRAVPAARPQPSAAPSRPAPAMTGSGSRRPIDDDDIPF